MLLLSFAPPRKEGLGTRLASNVPALGVGLGIYSAGKISHGFVVGLKTLPEEEHQVVAVAAHSAKFAQTHSIPRWELSDA